MDLDRTPRNRKQSLTQILHRWSGDDENAAAEVVPVVYEELRRIAQGYFRGERPGHTLQATAVVHEVYIRLLEDTGVRFQNRAHFVGKVAHMMRRLLVAYAREHNADRRGGGWQRVTLSEAVAVSGERSADLVALDDALLSLAAKDPGMARLVELRFFGGLSLEECAEALGISRASVVLEWRRTKAWLYRELTAGAVSGA
ncbi:MAG: RNA polymerase subunit sigma-70 [bacterium]|nr:RNA polymerase subunit sigma-70 [bacterium]